MTGPAGRAVADAHRREWASVLAATVRVTRDLDLAEECVQEAYARALVAWRADVPARPGAWLTTAARRRALDHHRHAAVAQRALSLLVVDEVAPEPAGPPPDDLLALLFTCCHPALTAEARVALTLRLLGGLSTPEIARAEKKIATAGVPFRVPGPDEVPRRCPGVLAVVHLVLTTGHTAPTGSALVRDDLVDRAHDLARLLRSRSPDDADVAGLLALVLLTDARRATRTDAAGGLVLLAARDRSRWDTAMIAEGRGLVLGALTARPVGRYAVLAAIAAVHADAPTFDTTDRAEIVGLYDVLAARWPSPVVALNRAVAIGFAAGPDAGLDALAALRDEPRPAAYGYLAAARGELLRRAGRPAEARTALEEAALLTANDVERKLLADRLASLDV